MPKRNKYSRFLALMQESLGIGLADFAKSLGKKTTNVSQYLAGTKKPGKRVLSAGLRTFAEWRVTPILEVEPIPDPLTSIPQLPGIYALFDSGGNTLYVGQAKKLRTEINQTLNRKVNFVLRFSPALSRKQKPKYSRLAVRVSAYVVESKRLRHNLEAL